MDPILNISLFQNEEEEEEEYHHSYYHSDSDSVSCFVTDLFESRSSNRDFTINPFSGVVCDLHGEPQLGLGFEIEPHNITNSQSGGLRIVDFGSDSDLDSSTEDEHEIDRVMVNNDDDDDGDGDDRVGGFDDFDVQLCWDSLCLEDQRTLNEGFEWEEVEERVNEIENEREDLSLVIDEVDINDGDDDGDDDDRSVASGFSNVDEPSEEALRYLEWEILLAVNNLERNPILEHDANVDSYLAVQDGYIYTAEYDVLFGQFMDNETALKGSPPAAKSVMENLPLVELTKEELQMKNVACAVCKDEILLEEKVRRLPCLHCYHGDCIMPWLSIRNTCPVCRFELPTDDPDYERRKSRQPANDLLDFATQMQF
ncbi:unnamed protein product [Lupinus luteus]|uniref:RING-type E3 ubiquitin transferase n=1 Tax=Lupinus luteus TaxID=3873 RepID=A0AAV1VQ31_LUPLU